MTANIRHGSPERLVSVQILRGIAALLVVALHLNVSLYDAEPAIGRSAIAHFAKWYQFGGIGVDMFFVISGFVMAFTMRQYKDRPVAFIRQRFLRIVPLCYFVTAVWLLLLMVGDRPMTAQGIISGITFLPLLPEYTEPTFRLLWTLSFEFAFYMLVCAALAFKLQPRQLLTLVCASGGFGILIELPLPLLRWLTHPVLLEFALGIAAFLIWQNKSWSRPALLLGGVVGGGILLIEMLFGPVIETSPTLMIAGETTTARLIFWGLPILLLFNLLVSWNPPATAAIRAMQAVGDASYAIYLTHLFPVYAAAYYLPLAPDARWLVGFGGAIGVGIIVHKSVERPLVRFFHGRRLPAATKAEHEHPIAKAQ